MAQRVYSAEEVDAFLHFVCLDKTLFGTPRNEAPEWWPCLLFQNMSELRDVTKQLDMVRDTASQREILLLCMRNLPQSLSCKVALLLGDRPPVRFILDATSGSLTAKPFLLDFLPLGDKNKNDKDFMQALCAVAPFLNAAVDSAKAAKDAGVENQFDSPDAKPAAKEAVVVREEEAAVSRCENARACQDASLNVGAGSASAPSPSLAPSPKRPAEVEASATSEASNQMQWTETADPMDEASISHVDQTLETETERGNDGPGESNEAVDPSFPNDLLPPNSLAAEKTTVNNAVASVFTVQNPRSGSSLESTESSTPQIRNKTKNNNYPSGDAGAERPLTSIAPQDEVETLRHATGSMQTPIAGNNNNNGHVKKTAASISSTGSLDTATRKKKVGRGKNNKSTSCKKRKRAPSTNTESSSKMKKESPFEIVEIPTFADVQPIFERGGYTFKDSKYCRPRQSAPVATTEAEFRKDLCAYGVNCRCGNTEENQACACWSEDDKWIIMLWVRYAVIRGSPPSDKVLLINPITARSYLYRLGFTHLNTQLIDGYVFPGMTTAKDGTISRSLNELWKFLSQFGLPEYCDYEKLTADKRFSLEYFVSTNEFRANTL